MGFRRHATRNNDRVPSLAEHEGQDVDNVREIHYCHGTVRSSGKRAQEDTSKANIAFQVKRSPIIHINIEEVL